MKKRKKLIDATVTENDEYFFQKPNSYAIKIRIGTNFACVSYNVDGRRDL